GIMILRNATLLDGNIASGAAANQGGGGIFNDGGRLALQSGTTLTANLANGLAGSGGGILTRGGIVTLDDSALSGNTAGGNGGGIEMVTGTLELRNSSLNLNVVGGSGGGLHLSGEAGAFVRIFGGTVNSNTAAVSGGG